MLQPEFKRAKCSRAKAGLSSAAKCGAVTLAPARASAESKCLILQCRPSPLSAASLSLPEMRKSKGSVPGKLLHQQRLWAISSSQLHDNLASSHKSNLPASCILRGRFMCLLRFCHCHCQEVEDGWRRDQSWPGTGELFMA